MIPYIIGGIVFLLVLLLAISLGALIWYLRRKK